MQNQRKTNNNPLGLGKYLKTDWNDIILHLVSSWNKKGTQLESLKRPENKQNTVESLKRYPAGTKKASSFYMKNKDIKMTLRYAHLSHDYKKQAIDNLGELWNITLDTFKKKCYNISIKGFAGYI